MIENITAGNQKCITTSQPAGGGGGGGSLQTVNTVCTEYTYTPDFYAEVGILESANIISYFAFLSIPLVILVKKLLFITVS